MSILQEDNEDDDVFNKNHGYDNERADYNWKTNDHIAYRYKIIDSIGKGSFGQVSFIRFCFLYVKRCYASMITRRTKYPL